jgi:hypothetical protein
MFTTLQHTLQDTLQNTLSKIQENIQDTFQTRDTDDESTPLLPPPPSSSQEQIQSHIKKIQSNNKTKTLKKENFPKVLTNQLYLDIRQKELPETSYLSFTNNTYTEHFQSSLSRSWVCTKSSFYFFIQAFYPNVFQHYASDNIIILSEEILDEYSNAINLKAEKITCQP